MRFGIDRVKEFPEAFSGRLALLTAPSGRTADNRSSVEVLRETGNLCLLLAPEHGVRGNRPAGEQIENGTDPETGIPVVSLYGENSRRLSAETLKLFDTLVYDIQDVGSRYYTFLTTLRYCLESCGKAKKKMVVLDRPNPLGDRVEGAMLRAEAESFVGGFRMPVCYGLTCGELAEMMNVRLSLGCSLTVIPCEGLTRDMTFRNWNRPWLMPSPNIPRYETALLYPGMCLLEGTNCSEGRGTADPFAIFGAPFIRSEAFCRAFEAEKFPGVTATPICFTPTASKYRGEVCGGLHLHIMEEEKLKPTELGIGILNLLRTCYPEEFRILPSTSKNRIPFLSLLAGHRDFENPDWDFKTICRRNEEESSLFREEKKSFERYPKEGE